MIACFQKIKSTQFACKKVCGFVIFVIILGFRIRILRFRILNSKIAKQNTPKIYYQLQILMSKFSCCTAVITVLTVFPLINAGFQISTAL